MGNPHRTSFKQASLWPQRRDGKSAPENFAIQKSKDIVVNAPKLSGRLRTLKYVGKEGETAYGFNSVTVSENKTKILLWAKQQQKMCQH